MNDTQREIYSGSVVDPIDTLRRLHAAVEARYDRAAERLGINRNDLRCLEAVQREGALSPGRLSAATGLSPAAVTKVLDRLGRAGLAERVRDGGDRRSVRVVVTEYRAEERRDSWRAVDSAARAVFDRLNAAELTLVTGVLSGLEAAYRDGTPPPD